MTALCAYFSGGTKVRIGLFPLEKNSLFLDRINQTMSDKGLLMAGNNVHEALAFIKASEPSFQEDYRRLVAKFEVNEELTRNSPSPSRNHKRTRHC
jgi:hypothetical protein